MGFLREEREARLLTLRMEQFEPRLFAGSMIAPTPWGIAGPSIVAPAVHSAAKPVADALVRRAPVNAQTPRANFALPPAREAAPRSAARAVLDDVPKAMNCSINFCDIGPIKITHRPLAARCLRARPERRSFCCRPRGIGRELRIRISSRMIRSRSILPARSAFRWIIRHLRALIVVRHRRGSRRRRRRMMTARA